jgi:hypothetical protein
MKSSTRVAHFYCDVKIIRKHRRQIGVILLDGDALSLAGKGGGRAALRSVRPTKGEKSPVAPSIGTGSEHASVCRNSCF